MEYIIARPEHTEEVFALVQETIQTIYPKYYPKEVVDFFCMHHNLDNIREDIVKQRVGLLVDKQIIVGTGCYKDNHITRVYVLPQYQRNGYGNYIIQCLEDEIAQSYEKVCLDASLPACQLYEKRGYITTEHCKFTVNNDVVLVYAIMEKSFPSYFLQKIHFL